MKKEDKPKGKNKYSYISISVNSDKKRKLLDYLEERNIPVTLLTRMFYDFILEKEKLPQEIEDFFLKYNKLLENKWGTPPGDKEE